VIVAEAKIKSFKGPFPISVDTRIVGAYERLRKKYLVVSVYQRGPRLSRRYVDKTGAAFWKSEEPRDGRTPPRGLHDWIFLKLPAAIRIDKARKVLQEAFHALAEQPIDLSDPSKKVIRDALKKELLKKGLQIDDQMLNELFKLSPGHQILADKRGSITKKRISEGAKGKSHLKETVCKDAWILIRFLFMKRHPLESRRARLKYAEQEYNAQSEVKDATPGWPPLKGSRFVNVANTRHWRNGL
jgi:hypothetical protein